MMKVVEDKLTTLIKQMDIIAEELSIANTFLLYILQAQFKQLDIPGADQYIVYEFLKKDNPAIKKYLEK